MRKRSFCILMVCFLLAGCGSKIEPIEQQEKQTEIKTEIETDATTTTEEDVLKNQIKEQSFDVTLDGWGEVTFASFMPKKDEGSNTDVTFKLLKNKEELYSFPGMSDNDILLNESFVKVVAVAFKDYNQDGKKDSIIINEYKPTSVSDADKTYHDIRLYTQVGEEKEFSLDNAVAEFVLKNHYDDSIDSIMKGIAQYQDIKISEPDYYGDFRVVSCKGTAFVSAMSQKEIDDRIGTTLTYQADSYRCNEASMEVPKDGYQEEQYSTEQFQSDFKVLASNLGIDQDEVLAVRLSIEGEFFGNYFYVLDENTLLIYSEGVFFEANRIKEN